MKKALFLLIPIMLFSQHIDSLVVTFTTPKGAPVQGVKEGYSKMFFQTGISNLIIDPEFTRAGSQDFRIERSQNGVTVFVNVKKLEKDREPGTYSNLLFTIKHPSFIDFKMDINIIPGRAYQFIVNPKTKRDVADGLLKLLTQIKEHINDKNYSDAKGLIESGRILFPTNIEIRAYELFLLVKQEPETSTKLFTSLSLFDQKNQTYSNKTDLQNEIRRIDGIIHTNIMRLYDRENYVDVKNITQTYLEATAGIQAIEKSIYVNHDLIKRIHDELDALIDMQGNGLVKNVEFIFQVSPPGTDVRIDGRSVDVERTQLTEDIEQIRVRVNKRIYSRLRIYKVNWVISDPSGDYLPMSSVDYYDPLSEWSLSYDTKETKQISRPIELGVSGTSSSPYLIGTAVLGAAVIYKLIQVDSRPNRIPSPQLPQSRVGKKPFMLKFGVSF